MSNHQSLDPQPAQRTFNTKVADQNDAVPLDITNFNRMFERFGMIVPGRDIFLSNVALVSGFQYGTKNRRVIELLILVEFAAAGIASSMIMPDPSMQFAYSSDHVTVHDLNVINIKKQFEVRRIYLFDQVDTQMDIVAKVAWMPLHGMAVVAAVEVL